MVGRFIDDRVGEARQGVVSEGYVPGEKRGRGTSPASVIGKGHQCLSVVFRLLLCCGCGLSILPRERLDRAVYVISPVEVDDE